MPFSLLRLDSFAEPFGQLSDLVHVFDHVRGRRFVSLIDRCLQLGRQLYQAGGVAEDLLLMLFAQLFELPRLHLPGNVGLFVRQACVIQLSICPLVAGLTGALNCPAANPRLAATATPPIRAHRIPRDFVPTTLTSASQPLELTAQLRFAYSYLPPLFHLFLEAFHQSLNLIGFAYGSHGQSVAPGSIDFRLQIL